MEASPTEAPRPPGREPRLPTMEPPLYLHIMVQRLQTGAGGEVTHLAATGGTPPRRNPMHSPPGEWGNPTGEVRRGPARPPQPPSLCGGGGRTILREPWGATVLPGYSVRRWEKVLTEHGRNFSLTEGLALRALRLPGNSLSNSLKVARWHPSLLGPAKGYKVGLSRVPGHGGSPESPQAGSRLATGRLGSVPGSLVVVVAAPGGWPRGHFTTRT